MYSLKYLISAISLIFRFHCNRWLSYISYCSCCEWECKDSKSKIGLVVIFHSLQFQRKWLVKKPHICQHSELKIIRFADSKCLSKLDTVCIRDLDKCKLIGGLLLGLSNFLPLLQLLQKIPLASKIKCSSYLRFFS